MTKTSLFCLAAVLAVSSLSTLASAKSIKKQQLQLREWPSLTTPVPPDLAGRLGPPLRSAGAADTFVLHDATFDTPNGQPTREGYVSVDMTAQLATFFHVANNSELNGGTHGNLDVLSGTQSMWCGRGPTSEAPFCGYATLPGYGNGWDQILITDPLPGDSVRLSYKVFWDSEGGYDGTVVEYTFNDGGTWFSFPVTDTLSERTGYYDNTGLVPFITETFAVGSPGATNVQVRFRFTSDTGWSDEDGIWSTDGAIIIDDITLNTWNGGVPVTNDTEGFEQAVPGSNTAGIWSGTTPPAFGDFAALYPGVSLLQEDPCTFVSSFVWGFFDDPAVTPYNCHTPDPRPDVGAMPFGTAEGLYMHNQIWSPPFANSGSGVEYRLTGRVYRDLPQDNLQAVIWFVRSLTAGCPAPWRNDGLAFFGGGRDWATGTFAIGPFIDPAAGEIQIAVGAIDFCPMWCNLFGSGTCHSHAPLIDDLRVERIAVFSPQYTVVGEFADNFAEDGTLTGTARADAGEDDEIEVSVAPVGGDPNTGAGPAVYCYVAVWPPGQTGKTPVDMEAPETRSGSKRYPLVGTRIDDNGVTWACFRFDTAVNSNGAPLVDKYAFDLNDDLFTPGDTVRYFYCADADATPANGNETYSTDRLDGRGNTLVTGDIDEAFSSPREFAILPAGGDILFVSRKGTESLQLSFDSAFELLGITDRVDRFDGGGLATAVKNNSTQIFEIYKTIIWSSGNEHVVPVGSGNWDLLFQFLNTSNKGPGLYLSGSGLAEEWFTANAAGAIQVRSVYMQFNLLNASHTVHGELVSPTLTATGPSFMHGSTADQLIIYGGCPSLSDFDVLDPGGAVMEFQYPGSGDGAVVSQQTTNAASVTATVFLSGFGYDAIHDATPSFPPARVEHLKDILAAVGHAISGPSTGIEDAPLVARNFLDYAYPNPFNPTTTITYGIKERGHVSLRVYNAAGQLVRTLVDQVLLPEQVEPVLWDGSNEASQTVSSGVYFYRLTTKNFSLTKKMVLLK